MASEIQRRTANKLGIDPSLLPADLDERVASLYAGGDTTTLKHSVNSNIRLHELRQEGKLNRELEIREVENTIESYYNFCLDNKKIPTPAGLCCDLGLTHRQLLKLLKEDSELGEVIRNGMEPLHALYQEGAVEGKIPTKTYTFFAKNYWNMNDKETIELTDGSKDVRMIEIDNELLRLSQL